MVSLQELKSLPDCCIYGLINKADKKIYIGYSYDILSALSRNIKDFKYSNHPAKADFDKLEFIILETVKDRSSIRFRYAYWYESYKSMGYSFYRDYKGSKFRVKIDVGMDFRSEGGTTYLVYVKLVNSRYKEFIVGVFSGIQGAKEFVRNKYQDKNIVTSIEYASNDLTRLYVKRNSDE